MPFTEDLTAFFNTSDFATAATLQGGATGAVKVIFDDAESPQLGAISSSKPVAYAKAADVSDADVVARKTLTINGTAYTLVDRHQLDDGSIVLLQLQAP